MQKAKEFKTFYAEQLIINCFLVFVGFIHGKLVVDEDRLKEKGKIGLWCMIFVNDQQRQNCVKKATVLMFLDETFALKAFF